MKLDIKALLILALLLGAAAFFWFAPNSGLQAAPALKMTTVDGQAIDLEKMQGKPYMMVFWATDCSGCVKEIPQLVELHKELNPKGFQIVGVAVKHDQKPLIQAMQQQRQIPYPLIHDSNGDIAKEFGNVMITPTNVLVSGDGKIVLQHMGNFKTEEMRERIQALL